MLWEDLIKIAYRELSINSGRSIFTIIGIVIGIMAIIAVMSIGQGAEKLAIDQLSGFGSETVLVGAGREPKGPSDIFDFLTNTLKEPEVEALQNKSKVSHVRSLSPAIFQTESAEYRGETKRGTLLGANEFVFDIFQVNPAEGRSFNQEEVRNYASVVVIGSKIRRELFGNSDAVGERVKIKNRTFQIIGVLPPKGNVTIFDADEFLVIPYTTMQSYITGVKHYHRVILQAESNEFVPIVVKDVKDTLRELHNITDSSKDDFFVDTQADSAMRVGIITNIFTALLMAVAAISLVVGGVGIMNIMLVSVTERTREIGLLKALGATNLDILKQFLLEAILITLVGGIIGIFLGGVFSYAASLILSQVVSQNWQFIFPVSAIILGVFIAFATGLIFGIYPAIKASEKDPIDALRFE